MCLLVRLGSRINATHILICQRTSSRGDYVKIARSCCLKIRVAPYFQGNFRRTISRTQITYLPVLANWPKSVALFTISNGSDKEGIRTVPHLFIVGNLSERNPTALGNNFCSARASRFADALAILKQRGRKPLALPAASASLGEL